MSIVNAETAYEVNTLNIDVMVNEDGRVTVNESLSINQIQDNQLKWELSNNYDYDWVLAGQSVSKHYTWEIENLEVQNYPFEMVKENNVTYVVIGNEAVPVKSNSEVEISYTMQLEDLGVGDIQEFSYLLLPDVPASVDCVSFRITMPKIFDLESLKFTLDGDVLAETDLDYDYQIVGTSIEGYINTPVNPYSSFMMSVDLGSSYFTFEKVVDVSLIIIGVSILLSIAAIIAFFLFGKDGLIQKTHTHLPPDGLNAASISYVSDGHVTAKDISALFIEWANLGYMRIEEVADVDNLYFVKLKDMGKERWKYERKLFNALFFNRTEVYANELDKYFMPYVSNAIKEIETIYSKNKENRVFTKSSMVMQLLSLLLAIAPIFIGSLYAFYNHFWHMELSLIFAVGISLCALVLELLWYATVSNKNGFKRVTYIGILMICAILTFVFAMVYTYIFKITIKVYGVCNATIACYCIVMLVMLFMDKRTPLGKAWYGEILGLKDFIVNSDEEALNEELIHNSDYFYDILPYAYILGVSDTWFKKFYSSTLSAPKWYKGKEGLTIQRFAPRYYRLLEIIRRHISSYPILHK